VLDAIPSLVWAPITLLPIQVGTSTPRSFLGRRPPSWVSSDEAFTPTQRAFMPHGQAPMSELGQLRMTRFHEESGFSRDSASSGF